MKQATGRQKEKLIHIRLEDKMHKRLKLYATEQETTIQNIVEHWIVTMLDNNCKKWR